MYLYHYPDIWYDYASWHAQNGSSDSAAVVFQRALKALPGYYLIFLGCLNQSDKVLMLGMIFLALHSCDSNCLMDHGCFVCLYMQGNRKEGFQTCCDKNSWIILWQIKHCFIMHLRNLKKLVGIFRLNSYLCLGWNSSAVFCNSVEASRVMQVLNCCYLVYVAFILFFANCC